MDFGDNFFDDNFEDDWDDDAYCEYFQQDENEWDDENAEVLRVDGGEYARSCMLREASAEENRWTTLGSCIKFNLLRTTLAECGVDLRHDTGRRTPMMATKVHLHRIETYFKAISRLFSIDNQSAWTKDGYHQAAIGPELGSIILLGLPYWFNIPHEVAVDKPTLKNLKNMIRSVVKVMKIAIDTVITMDAKDRKTENISRTRVLAPANIETPASAAADCHAPYLLMDKPGSQCGAPSSRVCDIFSKLTISDPVYKIEDHLVGPLGPSYAIRIFIPCDWVRLELSPLLHKCSCKIINKRNFFGNLASPLSN